ncbi:hypothetical protein BUALT_Bualt02G0169000 [Buddleja alternifolia]|uniref:IBH1-like N-terminal domain-containing protein n=1 Tax=Buddleja alternifolia TaxID=168488 RepID=A0AAV6Y7L5_9LAMI|nr:hypothetical protein BUALT_Bualt02G0169000 [Buddleja alternifolia]
MTTNKNLPTNPNPIKTRFAIKFLQAMKKLNKNNKAPSPSMANKYKRYRYHIIRGAAYSSMASAVGPRRAWSRAILSKIGNRGLHRYLMKRSRTRRRHAHFRKIRIRVVRSGNPRLLGFDEEQEKDLREIVPGGEEMGFCRLLNETAHYIKCLRAQKRGMWMWSIIWVGGVGAVGRNEHEVAVQDGAQGRYPARRGIAFTCSETAEWSGNNVAHFIARDDLLVSDLVSVLPALAQSVFSNISRLIE